MIVRTCALAASAVALAVTGCDRADPPPDAAAIAREAGERERNEKIDAAATLERREEAMREVGKRARARADADVTESDAREAERTR